MPHRLEPVTVTLYKLPYRDWVELPESVMYKFDAYEPRIIYQLPLTDSGTLTPNKVRLACVNGKLIKLDGAASKQLAESRRLPPPEFVLADIFNMEEKAYQAFCRKILGRATTERATGDVTRLGYERLGVTFKSQRLASGRLKESFELALRGVGRASQDTKKLRPMNIINTVAAFKDELMALDNLDLNGDIFNSAVIGGALIMLSLYPETIEFFRAYNERRWIKNDAGALDPVGALLKYVEDYRELHIAAQKNLTTHVCKCTVNAVVSWQAGTDSKKYWKKMEISSTEIRSYVSQVVRMKSVFGPFEDEYTDDLFWIE